MAHSFSSSPLAFEVDSLAYDRFGSPASPTMTQEDLPIEVDQSFNSSMSFTDASPLPPSPSTKPQFQNTHLLSPLPFRRPDPVPLQSPSRPSTQMMSSRPAPPKFLSAKPAFAKAQSFGAVPRAFGRDISNSSVENGRMLAPPAKSGMASTLKQGSKGKMLPPAVPSSSTSTKNGLKRAGLPTQWTSPSQTDVVPLPPPKALFRPILSHRETEPPLPTEPLSVCLSRSLEDDDMDVDSPCRPSTSTAGSSKLFKVPQSPLTMNVPTSADDSPGLGSFFCDSPGGPAALAAAKRRSLVSSSPASPSNSPTAKRAAIGMGKPLENKAPNSMLFGSSRPNTIASRRGQPYKRPPMGSITQDGPRTVSVSSAFPILYSQPEISASSSQLGSNLSRPNMAPMRRAFSVCDPPQHMPDMSEDDEDISYDSPSVSATHAEYSRRYNPRMADHIDGSPGFRPTLSAGIVPKCQASPAGNKGKKTSPYGPGGLPGFGDNEMDGKILPCHKVKEDGLVRITPDTLEDVLAGKYQHRMKRYHIIDCRFDYEYEGGHIGGAVSVKNMEAVEELLLKEGKGVHTNGDALPEPSRSGQLGQGQDVVLIFHCEFSAKRAPTFAKHLRSRDRMLNNHLYPKISYPELYILEGGYCGFFQARPERCFPRSYTPMDDPKHFVRRNSDLHDFRKFSRTRSFTYGETQPPPPSAANRPPCPPLAFAAASAAAGRRSVPILNGGHTIAEEEDGSGDSSCDLSLDGGPTISPCPRAVSLNRPPIFGSAKTRLVGQRGAFSRVASYAGTGPSQR